MIQNVIKLACGWNRIREVFKSLQKYIIRIAKKQRQFQKTCFKVLSKWHVTRIEKRKAFKCLQNYIIRITKKQRQFQKICFKLLSKWHVSGIELKKCSKVRRSISFELLRSQDSLKNNVSKCYENDM